MSLILGSEDVGIRKAEFVAKLNSFSKTSCVITKKYENSFLHKFFSCSSSYF